MQKQNRFSRTFGEGKAQMAKNSRWLAGKLKTLALGPEGRHLQCYNCRFDLMGFEAAPYNSMAFHSILITFRMVCQALKL